MKKLFILSVMMLCVCLGGWAQTIVFPEGKNRTVNAESGFYSIMIQTNDQWIVSFETEDEDPNWVKNFNHQITEQMPLGSTFDYYVEANNSTESRKGYLIFTAITDDEKTEAEAFRDTLTIIQKGKPSVTFDPTEITDVPATGETRTVSVTANAAWTTDINQEAKGWLSVSPDNGNEGTTPVTVTIAASQEATPRTGTITFTADGVSFPFNVNQKAKEPMPKPKLVNLSKWTNYYVGEKITVDFTLEGETLPEEKWKDIYSWEWLLNGSIVSGSYTPEGYFEFEATGYGTQSLSLRLTRNYESIESDPLEFTIWEQPSVQVWADEKEVQNKNTRINREAKDGDEFTITVHRQGGAESGWTVSWTDEDVPIYTEDSYTVKYDNQNESRIITLEVTNALEGRSDVKKWNYTFIVSYKENHMPTVTIKKTPDVNNVFSGKEVKFSFELPSEFNKNDFTWKWKVDNTVTEQAEQEDTLVFAESVIDITTRVIELELQRTDGETVSASKSIIIMPEPFLSLDNVPLVPETTISKTLGKEETWDISLQPSTRNIEGWEFSWVDQSNNMELSPSNDCSIGYIDDIDERNIILYATYKLSGKDGEEETGQWHAFYTFNATFNDMPIINLIAQMKGSDGNYKNVPNDSIEGTHLVSGTDVKLEFKLYKDNKPIEYPEKEYKWYWDNDPSTLNKDSHSFEATTAMQKVTFDLVRKADEITKKSEWNFTVWPKPEVIPTWSGGTKENPMSLTDDIKNNSISLSVKLTGGYTKGWTTSWIIDDDIKSDSTKCILKYQDYQSRKDTMVVKLHVENKAPAYETAWIIEDYSVYIKFTGENAILITTSADAFADETSDGKIRNVLGKDRVKLTYDTSSELTDPEWVCEDGATIVDDFITFKDVTTMTIVTATLKSKNAEDAPVTFKVWPEPKLASSWKMSFNDINNPENNTDITAANKPIYVRQGNKIELSSKFSLTGGYDNSSTYVVRLQHANKTIDGTWTADDKSFEYRDGKYEDVIECVAQTYFKDGKLMGERPLGTFPIWIYQKPKTPTSLDLKGDGTSGTWFVGGYTEEADSLLLGMDSDGSCIEIEIKAHASDWSWIVSDAVDKRQVDKYFVYTVKYYEYYDNNKVRITSGKKYINDIDDLWDKSGTRSESQGIDNLKLAGGKSANYNLNGVRTTKMERGLNIIRMEDGTVKKVFKK